MPLICTPLIGKNGEALVSEMDIIMPQKPDLLEWRADYYEDISDFDKVIALAERLRALAGGTPLLFTMRSPGEGGQPVQLTEKRIAELYTAICQSQFVDLIDYELSHAAPEFNAVRKAAREKGIKLISSYHNFTLTPSPEFIQEKLAEAVSRGADIAKVAVMPQNLEDVLSFLNAILKAETLPIPIIAMAMGRIGLPTRMIGGLFGSAVTFAVGAHSSAPGQIPLEDLKAVFRILRKAFGG